MFVCYKSKIKVISNNKEDIVKFIKNNIQIDKEYDEETLYLRNISNYLVHEKNIDLIKEDEVYNIEFSIFTNINKMNWDNQTEFINSLKKFQCDAYISQYNYIPQYRDNCSSQEDLVNKFKIGKSFEWKEKTQENHCEHDFLKYRW